MKIQSVVKTFDIKGIDKSWMPTEEELERLARGGILYLFGSDIIVDGLGVKMVEEKLIQDEHKWFANRIYNAVRDYHGDKILNSEQIEAILKVVIDMCPHCWDAERGCQCWNDE
jgi:hypothetical protein